ncbi:MAG: hypothetical protein ACKVQT_33935 [Burkholderiales bacterium]
MSNPIVALLAAPTLLASPVDMQTTYGVRTVKIIVPFAAGNITNT